VSELGTVSFPALGTTASLIVTDPEAMPRAEAALRSELDDIDRACSRFRPDSELEAINTAAGRPVRVSALCLIAVEAALRAARLTDGRVDPTVGRAMQLIGYDRDFPLVAREGPEIRVRLQPVPGWYRVVVDRAASTVMVPAGVELDLGATAKALCADRAAAGAAFAVGPGIGILVNLGGDIAVAGPPPDGGWVVQVAHDHAEPLDAGGPAFSITSGGLATSSTSVRRWTRGGRDLHHLIDPATGGPAVEFWRTVTVAAASCLDANIASCASIILGAAAPGWLEARRLPARLVGPGGRVTTVGGWPAGFEPAGRGC
jgi:thiamine biosynthesis lipoprotein